MSENTSDWLARESLRLGAECRDLARERDTLKADNEELHKDYEALADEHTKLIDRNKNLKAENERLRASSFVTAVPVEQYERLVKAGDAMADNLYIPVHHETYLKLLSDWNAAKEGKPSV